MTNYQLRITNCELPITNYELPITERHSRGVPRMVSAEQRVPCRGEPLARPLFPTTQALRHPEQHSDEGPQACCVASRVVLHRKWFPAFAGKTSTPRTPRTRVPRT